MKFKPKFKSYRDLEERASKVDSKRAVIQADRQARLERAEKDPDLLQTILEGAFKGLPS
jgi:hypothetical protein